MLLVNLYGGPGSGKSTVAAGVFERLKHMGISCEMAREYIKDKVWARDLEEMKDQHWIFANQLRRITILKGQVDVAITDSPILLSLLYEKDNTSDTFKKFVLEQYLKFNNMDVSLSRVKKFEQKGRVHNEEQSRALDNEILDMMYKHCVPGITSTSGDKSGVDVIVREVIDRLKEDNVSFRQEVGKVTQQFKVVCAVCKRWYQSGGTCRQTFTKKLREKGWSYVDKKWVCGTCRTRS